VSKELKAAKLIANEERRARNEVQEKLEKIFEELDENLKRAKTREDGLLKLLQEKDEDLADQTRVISQLKVNLRNLEHEKMQIMDVIGENKTELSLSNFERLSKELVLVKSLLEESECQRHKLQALIQEMPETPSKLSNFLSPISLKSLEIDASEEVGDRKELGCILEDLSSKFKTGIPEKRIPIFKESDLNTKNMNLDSFSHDLKNHRRRATTGFIKVYKENSRK
jgi:chromosome segregation ATPase